LGAWGRVENTQEILSAFCFQKGIYFFGKEGREFYASKKCEGKEFSLWWEWAGSPVRCEREMGDTENRQNRSSGS
jgi:hypothetical protein